MAERISFAVAGSIDDGSPHHIDMSSCATVSLAQAALVLGVHRSTAWDLYQRGEFPVPVLRVGQRLRVSKTHLERFVLSEADTARLD
jgi:hypothetical protein